MKITSLIVICINLMQVVENLKNEPIHIPKFVKKKGSFDIPVRLILLPMFASHPYTIFHTKYSPGRFLYVRESKLVQFSERKKRVNFEA